MVDETIERQFQVEGTASVQINNVNGSIMVQPGPAGEVSIKAVQRGNRPAPVEIGQAEDGSVYVQVKQVEKKLNVSWLRPDRSRVDFHVTVPEESDLVAKTVNGATNIKGVRGTLEIGAVNGGIEVADLSGDIKISTVNGKISGSRVSGEGKLKTVNGKIHIADSNLPSLTAGTVNGSIRIDTPIGEGPYELKTVSGNVKILTDDAPAGRVHFKSVSGSMRVNNRRIGKNGNVSGGPSRKVFTFGKGGPDFYFKSVSGNLDFQTSSGEAEQIHETVSEEAGSGPDLMSILDRIADGELSVEDGISELNGS